MKTLNINHLTWLDQILILNKLCQEATRVAYWMPVAPGGHFVPTTSDLVDHPYIYIFKHAT